MCFFCVLTSPSRSHRAKCVPCGPDLRGVRLVGGAYPFPNLPPLLSHRELCPGTAPAHLPAPPQRLPAWQGTESKSIDFISCGCNYFPLCLCLLVLPSSNIAFTPLQFSSLDIMILLLFISSLCSLVFVSWLQCSCLFLFLCFVLNRKSTFDQVVCETLWSSW